MGSSDTQYLLKVQHYGLRLYEHERDEQAVCKLCWSNALPGGRPFPLIPEAGALSFGRFVTGPFAEHAPQYFFVAEDLTSGKLIGYFAGADGEPVVTANGPVPWMDWRDKAAERIAQNEFGEISYKLYVPTQGYVEGAKLLYALSLGLRAIQFLLHVRFNKKEEIPLAPQCPEFHFHIAKGHRGKGIGKKFVEYFLSQFPSDAHNQVCAQVTLCDGQKPLSYYEHMCYRGKPVWKVFDKKQTTIYTEAEKIEWDLGPIVENATLVADKKRLLGFVRQKPKSPDSRHPR